MQALPIEATKSVAGGSFELEMDSGFNGQASSFPNVSVSISFGVGPISVGVEIGSCGP